VTDLPLGQLFVFGFDGPELSPEAHQLLTKHQAGGVTLFRRNITSLEQVVQLNTAITNATRNSSPALISVDQEGGRVARLKGICTDVPPMRVIGEASKNDPGLPYRIGAMMARELSVLGFHLDFAPVMDVDSNPQNPVIGDRSFSPDAKTVAELGGQYIRGMQGAGIAACAKHFPGHGDTDTDSHFDLPILRHDMARLEQTELVPFREAIRANVSSIMTAHILFPDLDAAYPATLSRPIIDVLLRQELGFDGLVISDDMEMKAVADRYATREMVKLGLLAGVDLFLICKDMHKAVDAIASAHDLVECGEVPRERVLEAIARVDSWKRRYIGAVASPVLDEARKIVRCAPHLQLVEQWSRS